MTDKEVMQMALDIMESAIKAGDWVVDGACDPDLVLNALRAALAQPEPAECDGGQCGIGGYCKQCPKTQPEQDYEAEFIKDWNEGKVRRVSDGKRMVPEREWQGLTDEEYEAMAEQYVTNCYFDTLEYAKAIEAKLKEKNT